MRSQADTVESSATIANVAPTVDSVILSNESDDYDTDDYDGDDIVTPNTNGQKTLYVTGAVSDTNGDGDIAQVDAAIYRTPNDKTCSSNANYCYQVADCTTVALDGDSLNYSCMFAMDDFVDATDVGSANAAQNWDITVTVTDQNATPLTGTKTRDGGTLEVATTESLVIPATIAFGSRTNNEETTLANNDDMTITQQGNDSSTVSVSMASDMSCTELGTIPKGNVEWSLTDGAYGTGADLTASPVDSLINFPEPSADTETDIIHWNIKIPQYDVAGTCTSDVTITVSAV